MKYAFLTSLLLTLILGVSYAIANPANDPLSLNDLKSTLKADSSDSQNSELSKEVLLKGVSFQYTMKRENKLREWGANDELIAAIWQSIVDETEERRMYRAFMSSYGSEDKATRKIALEKGKQYLKRFESNERFEENVSKIQKEVGFLACEFDPSLEC